jgi:hypothetical protein
VIIPRTQGCSRKNTVSVHETPSCRWPRGCLARSSPEMCQPPAFGPAVSHATFAAVLWTVSDGRSIRYRHWPPPRNPPSSPWRCAGHRRPPEPCYRKRALHGGVDRLHDLPSAHRDPPRCGPVSDPLPPGQLGRPGCQDAITATVAAFVNRDEAGWSSTDTWSSPLASWSTTHL